MSADSNEIITPNKRKVVVRNYTTRSDDRQATELLNKGQSHTIDASNKISVIYSAESIEASNTKYVELLVESIDGKTENLSEELDNMRSLDYQAVLKEVQRVCADPKAPESS